MLWAGQYDGSALRLLAPYHENQVLRSQWRSAQTNQLRMKHEPTDHVPDPHKSQTSHRPHLRRKPTSKTSTAGFSPGEAQGLARSMATMESKYEAGSGPRPELHDFIALMNAWVNSGLLDGPQQAARVLERLETLQVLPAYQHLNITPECYLIVVKAFAVVARLPSLAEIWLEPLEKCYIRRGRMVLDTSCLREAYNICLESWSRMSDSRSKRRGFPARAWALLKKFQQFSQENEKALGPDTYSYSCVLQAFARIGDSDKAKEILSDMEKIFESDPLDSNIQPDSMAYTSVIHAMAASDGGEKAALDAEQLLRRMHQLSSRGINRNAKPNAYTYEAVMTAWAKSRTGIKGAKRTEAIFEHMNRLYRSGNHDVKPLTININAVIKAWSVSKGGTKAAARCESILRCMDPGDNFLITNRIPLWPTIETTNSVVLAWTNAGTRDAPERAEGILSYLDEWNQSVPKRRRIQPNLDTYNMIIASYLKSNRKESARRAEALLYRLVNLGTPDIDREDAIEKAFGMVVSCWAKSSDPSSTERSEQLLRVLQKNHKEGLSGARPNVVILSNVIDSWSKSKTSGAVQKAKALFENFMNATDVQARPNTITCNSMLNAYANSKDINAVSDSEQLLKRMFELREQPGWDVEPNSRSMVSYMACLAKHSNMNTSYAPKVEELIAMMLSEAAAGNKKMLPDSFAFATAINAWAWSSSASSAQGVLRIIDLMETLYYNGLITSPPHAICYNTAVRFFLEMGDLQTADSLVRRMESAFMRGTKEAAADCSTYAALLNAYAQHSDVSSHEFVADLFSRQLHQSKNGNVVARPNAACFNMVMASFAKSENSTIRAQALSVLDTMKTLSTDDDDVKPDVVSFSTAINVLSKSPDKNAAGKVIMLLTEMDARYQAGDSKSKPNLFSFNSVLNALSKSRSKTAAIKAEELLLKMTELSETNPAYSDVRPDLLSFTSVLEAWAGVRANGAPERAEAILRQMLGGGEARIYPDVVAFNKVILAFVRNANPNKAEAILREMETCGIVKPDGFTYKTVLLGWAQQRDGVAKAEEILELWEHQYALGHVQQKPDSLCYKALMGSRAYYNKSSTPLDSAIQEHS